jgi:hypothetical protein
MPVSPVVDLLRPELSEISACVPAGEYAVRLDGEAPPLLSPEARARLAERRKAWELIPTRPRPPSAPRSPSAPASARRVLVGVGSDEIITMLLTAFAQPRGSQAPVVRARRHVRDVRDEREGARQRVLEVPLDAH